MDRQRRTSPPIRPERGFILPLSIILVLVLTISGMGFMQHDYLERRMVIENADNQSAFYLANAGLERARKAWGDLASNGSWTNVLKNSPKDSTLDSLDQLLCPNPATQGCAVPPFGEVITSQTSQLPFGNGFNFNDGEYRARAFNNVEGPTQGCTPPASATKDCDGILIIRSLGRVRGELKLLEAKIQAASGLRIVNCGYDGNSPIACPQESRGEEGYLLYNFLKGHEPKAIPLNQLPEFDTNAQTFYKNPSNFGLPSKNFSSGIQSGGHYFITGNVTIPNVIVDKVVIFSTGTVTLSPSPILTNSVVVGLTGVNIGKSTQITAPRPFPAIISGGFVTTLDQSYLINGSVYAAGDMNITQSGTVQGVLLARDGTVNLKAVEVKDGLKDITDDKQRAAQEALFYAAMPGFNYPSEFKNGGVAPGSWRELE